MREKEYINKQVEETMASLHSISKASPQPFFYTRLHARLQKSGDDIFEKISYYITRPSFLAIGICIIFLINVLALSEKPQEVTPIAEESERVYSGEEYTLTVNSYYVMETGMD